MSVEINNDENNPSQTINTTSATNTINNAIDKLKNDDAGAHWELNVIEAANYLFLHDKPTFQRKRSELKAVGLRAQISEWTKEVKGCGNTGMEDNTKADELVALITDSSELFHNSNNDSYATFEQNNHAETWALGSKGWLFP